MIREYNTEESCCVSSHPSSLKIRCREEDFVFDESKVQAYPAPEPVSALHEVSSSVDFTISNDSSSRLQKRDPFRPSLLIEDESKLWHH